MFDLDATSSAC